MFVDIHSHILPGIDDGAEDINMAVDMIKLAASNGTAHIVATPHFISETLYNSSADINNKCCELRRLMAKSDLEIRIIIMR